MIRGAAIQRGELATGGRRFAITLGAAIGVVAGMVAIVSPLAAAAFALAAAIVLLLALGPSVVPLFQVALAIVLAGYAFLNRGFAYIGAGGVYVGELVLALGLFATVYSATRIRISVAHIAILAFMAWGAIRTIPYIGPYGVDALRDGVAWAYAFIALAVATTLTPPAFRIAVRWYGALVPVLVVWFPIAAVVYALFGDLIPTAPGADVPIIYFKAGDAGVHLAGVGAFILTGLFAPAAGALPVVFAWTGWLTSLGLVAAINRGGMLAASMCALSVLFVRRLGPWLIAATVGVAILAGGWIINPQIDLGLDRALSFQQLTENMTSILEGDSNTQTEATKNWRLMWWDEILQYTVNGPYFWEGKGYGINLADDDGFQVEADGSLRSPHSAHFEILARSGVTGVALWIGVQLSVWFVLFRAARRARQLQKPWWLAVTAWLGVYWLANVVNMSFDVYLAGPMGGFWFWGVVGAIIALDRVLSDGGAELDAGGPDPVEPGDPVEPTAPPPAPPGNPSQPVDATPSDSRPPAKSSTSRGRRRNTPRTKRGLLTR